jgi:hypothetical protein
MPEGISGRVSVSLALGLALASLLFVSPRTLQAASSEQIITFSGETISSIFEGLNPSHFAEYSGPTSGRSRKISGLLEEKSLDALLGARLRTVCTTCDPDTPCSGHYEKIIPCSGCCVNPVGCGVVNNFVTDTVHQDYDDGEYDTYCGANCCVDSQPCTPP